MRSDLAGRPDASPTTELPADSVEQYLDELALLGSTLTADGLSCTLLLRQSRDRAATSTACSDLLARAADEAQRRTGDGPCLDVLRHARPVLIDDTEKLPAGSRWERFCGHAAAAGVRSCYALPLTVDGEALGALALYSRLPSAFGPAVTARAALFARHASGTLSLVLRMASYADRNDQLRTSLASRAVIDQAVGVIMATEHCSHDRAFALLRGVSQNTNVKLRALAADIVTNVSGEPPRPTTPFQDG